MQEFKTISINRCRKYAPVFALTLLLAVTCGTAYAGDSDELGMADAKKYMIDLINKDRKTAGLKPVAADEAGEKAGQLHSDEMAEFGYLSHWDLKGRKPDQRYGLLGGTGFVMENAHIEFSGYSSDEGKGEKKASFKIDPDAKVSKKDLEDIESGFFNEKPPNDGHRRNILDPDHTHVGIGLSVAKLGESSRLTCTQELIHNYGKIELEPGAVTLGLEFVVKGKLDPGIQLQSLDLYWEELPKTMTVKQLEETHSYGPPTTKIASFYAGSSSSANALTSSIVDGQQEFSCKFVPDATWKPGLYYVYVFAKQTGTTPPKSICVASKTIEVQ